jgi:hypothetical protein
MLLRDSIASMCFFAEPKGDLAKLRERSFHSSCTLDVFKCEVLKRMTKGNILESKSQEIKVFENNVSVVQANIIGQTDSFATLVRKELQLYKNKHNVYNGIIHIIKKPEFLIACFKEIQAKA